MSAFRLKAARLRWVVAGCAALGAVAAYVYFVYAPPPRVPVLSGEFKRHSLQFGGQERSFHVYAPAHLQPGAPLLLVLHGSLMNGADMRRSTGYEFDVLADKHGLAVVYPDGYKGNWNDCRRYSTFPAKTANIDDVGFMKALVARLQRDLGINPGQVFAFGYSNGGQMAFRLAIEIPEQVPAITAVSATMPTADNFGCAQTGRTGRVMLVNGTADPIVPFGGGMVTLFGFASRGAALSSLATAAYFAERNGMPPDGLVLDGTGSDGGTMFEERAWPSAARPFVTMVAVRGGGHVVPQPSYRFPRFLGRTAAELDAPVQAVNFFLR